MGHRTLGCQLLSGNLRTGPCLWDLFKDTWHAAIGARYRFAEPWLWSVGFAYDGSPVYKKDRTPDMPLDRQIRPGTGLQYNWNQNVTLVAPAPMSTSEMPRLVVRAGRFRVF